MLLLGALFVAVPSRSFSAAGRSPAFSRFLPRSLSTATSCASSTMVAPVTFDPTLPPAIHSSFSISSTTHNKEYNIATTTYKHKKSGAECLSIRAADDNKVFMVAFRTPPTRSDGVAHILEHSVLCGSKKYTSKEPFVELIKGSLNTFLNAFTYPDRTCYPVASLNTKDFYNLANVYLDAVFHPRAKTDPMVHAQEGWHLEAENAEDDLIYKGVVFNEMKGVYSSPDSLLGRESMRSLFPDTTYGVDSGGDPNDIVKLSFDEFADFHSQNYDPSNAKLFFYGDDDELARLNLLDEYLKDFTDSKSREKSTIPYQKKTFTEPQTLTYPYPASENDGSDPNSDAKSMLTVNWLLNDTPMSSYDQLAFTVLDHLLLGTSASILQKRLMESQLGEAITGGGLSDELLQATFSIGLKGVKESNLPAVEALVAATLDEVVRDGFETAAVAASMNTLEFQLREFNTGSFPKGLSLMLGALSKWNYDAEPTDAFKFEEDLAALKKDLAANGSKVFTDLLSTYVVKNSHKTTIIMNPDSTLEAQQVEEEKAALAEIKKGMTKEQIDEVIETTKRLKILQAAEDSPESIATIPSLTLEDLDPEVKEYPLEVSAKSGVTVVTSAMPSTSGILYTSLAVDVSDVPLDDAPLISIMTRLMSEAGTSSLSDVELAQKIGTYTGGVGAAMSMMPVLPNRAPSGTVRDTVNMLTKVFIKGKTTKDRGDELFSIMSDMLTDPKLDSQSKVVEMLKEKKSRAESSIQGSGHSYANTRLKARHSVAGYLDEFFGGISSLDRIKSLLSTAENDWPAMLSKLQSIHGTMLKSSKCRDGMLLNVIGDEATLALTQPSMDSFLKNLPGDEKSAETFRDFYKEAHPWAEEAKVRMAAMGEIKNEGFIVPTQVNYVGAGGQLYEIGEKTTGAATVVARHLRTGYLWDTVRVIGGAYGGFCTFAPGSGLFTYLSYRDPNFATTLDAYEAAADALLAQAESLTKEQLETAVIGAVGDLDSALSADQKGNAQYMRWLANESPEERQKFRTEVLGTTKEDFVAFAKRLKGLKMSTSVVSSKGGIEEAIKAGRKMEVVELL